MTSTIELEDVSKEYVPGVRAVDGVDLEVAAGEFVVLVGPSGCGKSTLLRMVAGLEELTAGSIHIGGQDVSDVEAKHRDLAMVFQSYALFPHMTVEQNMGFGLRMRKVPKAEIRAKVAGAAELLELTHLLGRRPAALSGGQRQRVAMGRALVREARAFLMDEPLSNLDAQLRGVMRTELRKLHQRAMNTTLYVTHDQVEALTLGDRVAVLRDGVLQQCASPREIFAAPANVFVAAFIGSPAMNLVETEVSSAEVRLGGARLRCPQAGPEGSRVVLGLRPTAFEDAALARDEALARLTVMPEVVEDLGEEKHVVFGLEQAAVVPDELRAGDEGSRRQATLTARVGARSNARVGVPLELVVDHREAHVFDRETGIALRD